VDSGRCGLALEAFVESVVERPGALHHRHVLRDARQLERVAPRVLEAAGELLGELGDVRSEERDEAAGEECIGDVPEIVGSPLLRAVRRKAGLLAKDRAVKLLESRARIDAELLDERLARGLVGLERLGLTS
jgi:hypothetical protein